MTMRIHGLQNVVVLPDVSIFGEMPEWFDFVVCVIHGDLIRQHCAPRDQVG